MSSAVMGANTVFGAMKRKGSRSTNSASGNLRMLAANLLQTQEEEKRRIGRELHDGVNQKLSMIVFDLDRLRQSREAWPEDLDKQLGSVRHLALDVADEIRTLCGRMHPALLEHFGLSTALRVYCTRFEERQGIHASFEVSDSCQPADKDLCLGLYRIVQEALHNVSKHACATEVEVRLETSATQITLRITDNGKGFSPVGKGGLGIGLVSMEERARLAGGEFRVRSAPGRGTTILVSIPLHRSNERGA